MVSSELLGAPTLSQLFAPSHIIAYPAAIAAGMMIAASFSLAWEGWFFEEPDDVTEISSPLRTMVGALLGFAFILGTKQFLEKYEDLKVGGLAGADARRALLIFFVMTLHSFSEGVGIGVSFGGADRLGTWHLYIGQSCSTQRA
jgi:zinc transporter ZupT